MLQNSPCVMIYGFQADHWWAGLNAGQIIRLLGEIQMKHQLVDALFRMDELMPCPNGLVDPKRFVSRNQSMLLGGNFFPIFRNVLFVERVKNISPINTLLLVK